MFQLNSTEYIIKSETDNQCYKIDKNIINASVLFKNLCGKFYPFTATNDWKKNVVLDLTDITEPIVIKCSGKSIETFIKLISHYRITESHDTEFEKLLYNNFNDDELAELVKDLSILDSNIFIKSVADYILEKMCEMDRKKMQEYMGLEDDFTFEERKIIDKNRLEYFLGNNFDGIGFPFPDKSFYSLKTKFYSPFNVLLASIVERSNEAISYQLALINKALKNEINRFPLKFTRFHSGGDRWIMEIFPNIKFFINVEKCDQNIFNIIKKRKLMAENFDIYYSNSEYNEANILCSSFNFALPKKFQRVEICIQCNDLLQCFDTLICPFPSILFNCQGGFHDNGLDFKTNIYDHLILKDLSKEIELYIQVAFNIFSIPAHIRLYKKSNRSKFYRLDVRYFEKIGPEFEDFVNNFMDDESVINVTWPIDGIPEEKSTKIKKGGYHSYAISVIKEYLECIVSKI